MNPIGQSSVDMNPTLHKKVSFGKNKFDEEKISGI